MIIEYIRRVEIVSFMWAIVAWLCRVFLHSLLDETVYLALMFSVNPAFSCTNLCIVTNLSLEKFE